MNKHVGAMIDYDLWRRFSIAAKKKDVRQSEVIRQAIRKFIKENQEGEKTDV